VREIPTRDSHGRLSNIMSLLDPLYAYCQRKQYPYAPMSHWDTAHPQADAMVAFPSGWCVWAHLVGTRPIYTLVHPSRPRILCLSWDAAEHVFEHVPTLLTSAEEGHEQTHG
jgi:hypothetical protein